MEGGPMVFKRKRLMKRLILSMLLCAGAMYGANTSVKYIQRSMAAMEYSTEKKPSVVRVFFYGQSIVAQNWTDLIEKQLRDKYPTVQFEFCKKAIGGFTSEALVRTAENDLYPWNPDLLFFHVYGSLVQYEEIIRKTRERTAAEIILWSSHLSKGQDPQAMLEKRDARSQGIEDIARRYDCMYIDLNKKWCGMLLSKKKQATDFLRDNIHLNPEGVKRYAQFIGEELVRVPEYGEGQPTSGKIITIQASDFGDAAVDGSQTVAFTGNRVVAISNGKGKEGVKAEILLDGKPLATMTELWGVTRSSTGPYIWMPALKHIGFEKPLLEEDWKLVCQPDSSKDGKFLHYKVTGSKTGDDGEGTTMMDRFVSVSGRVIIERRDWHVAWPLSYTKHELPENFTVTWKTYPLFTTPYAPQPAGTRTLLIQGCSNGGHALTFKGATAEELGIGALQVNCPSFKP